MEFITYSSKFNNEELLKYNIFLSSTSKVSDGVKLYCGVKVYGESCIQPDVELHSNTEIRDSIIRKGTKIYSTIITNSEIGENNIIKPFGYISNSSIGDANCVGNFVCINNCNIGSKCSINSLCSLLNTEIGNNLKMLSGACCEVEDNSITIGDSVVIGSNATIIEPVIISDNAKVDANTIITKDIDVGQKATSGIKQINK